MRLLIVLTLSLVAGKVSDVSDTIGQAAERIEVTAQSRAVQPGEHPRAGRWWWEHEEKKECGLHMNPRREGKAA